MRVLCTGGAGYIGSATLRYLLRQGHEAFAYDNLTSGNRAAVPDPSTRLIVGDILDQTRLEQTLSSLSIDAVMHFAAVASVPESLKEPGTYWQQNVEGTRALLDAMVACGVHNIVFTSTAAVYALDAEMPVAEDIAASPSTPYGRTKLACEFMLADYQRAHDVGYTSLRCFNAAGADLDGQHGEDRRNESHLIPLMLQAAEGHRSKLLVFGQDWSTDDRSAVRDFVHVLDVAQAHTLAMEQQVRGKGRVFNLGSGHGASVLAAISACEQVLGKTVPWETAARRAGDPAVLVADNQRLCRELGWRPQHSELLAIVESVARWAKNFPTGYGS